MLLHALWSDGFLCIVHAGEGPKPPSVLVELGLDYALPPIAPRVLKWVLGLEPRSLSLYSKYFTD